MSTGTRAGVPISQRTCPHASRPCAMMASTPASTARRLPRPSRRCAGARQRRGSFRHKGRDLPRTWRRVGSGGEAGSQAFMSWPGEMEVDRERAPQPPMPCSPEPTSQSSRRRVRASRANAIETYQGWSARAPTRMDDERRHTLPVDDDVFRTVYDSPASLPGCYKWLTSDEDVRRIESVLGMSPGTIGAPLWLSGDEKSCSSCGRLGRVLRIMERDRGARS